MFRACALVSGGVDGAVCFSYRSVCVFMIAAGVAFVLHRELPHFTWIGWPPTPEIIKEIIGGFYPYRDFGLAIIATGSVLLTVTLTAYLLLSSARKHH